MISMLHSNTLLLHDWANISHMVYKISCMKVITLLIVIVNIHQMFLPSYNRCLI